ncbi:MAG: glycosyltransferase, partial [Nitrospirales bacterium]|nr:glycosyltransferase [Nitrospirales bacterium]
RWAAPKAGTAEAVCREAVALANTGDHEGARRLLEAFVQTVPDSALAHNNLGALYEMGGNMDNALVHYEKAAQLRPEEISYQKNLAALCAGHRHNMEKALRIYLDVLKKAPDDVESLLVIGNICAIQGMPDDAKQFYRKVLAIEPNNRLARENMLNLRSDRDNSRKTENSTEPSTSGPEKGPDIQVSAIVSAYNSERFIRGCLQDLVDQSLYKKGRVEIIVVDSGSSENEREIVEEFQARHRNITYLRTERETVYAAWNRAIEIAQGTYITNANTDDRHREDCFELLASCLDNNPGVVLAYADVLITETENETFRNCHHVGTYLWHEWDRNTLLDRGCFMGPQPMWRKSIHDIYGYFDETMVTSGDYELWLRISQTSDFLHIPNFLGLYLTSPDSIEHRNRKQQAQENKRILSKYRDAADRGALIRFRPLNDLRELFLKGSEAFRRDAGELIARLVTIAGLDGEEAFLPDEGTGRHEKDFMLLRSALLDAPDEIVLEQLCAVFSRMMLTKTGWWKARYPESMLESSAECGKMGMTSIVIVPSARQDHLLKCLRSIMDNTVQPYEMIFMETPKQRFGQSVRKQVPELAAVTWLDATVGKGQVWHLNRAISSAKGEFVVLLKDNVIVHEQWLERMLDHLKGTPKAGIVGCMETNSCGRQSVAIADKGADEAARYAGEFLKRNLHRQALERNIAGPCFLFEKSKAEKTGLFDEGLEESRFMEDFCIRVELAGYRNLIAGDVLMRRIGDEGRRDSDPLLGGKRKKTDEKWTGIDITIPPGCRLLILRILEKAEESWNMDMPDEAIKMLVEGIRRYPEEKKIRLRLAEMLLESKEFGKGVEILSQAPSPKEDAEILCLMGYCYEGLGDPEQAEACADRALSLMPCNAAAINLKGVLAYKKEDRDKAAELFGEAAEASPSYGEPLTNLGVLRWADGQEAEGLDLLEKGFILAPGSTDSASLYHSAVSALGAFSRAERVFTEAQALNPAIKRVAFFFIDILLKQGKYAEAMEVIEESLVRFGIDAEMMAAALAVREKVGAKKVAKGPGKTTLSLCMIVKNEEKYLAKCLNSVKTIVDEMVIVDTGSTDRTSEIARVFGARVFDFPWQNDFAEARNASLERAEGDWILVLDGDEVIAGQDTREIKTLVEGHRKGIAYNIDTRNYTRNVVANWTGNEGDYAEEAGSGWFPSTKVRLFPNDRKIRFANPVHELVEPTLRSAGYKIIDCSTPIHHYGKLDQDKTAEKGEAYYLLGMEKLRHNGNNAKAVFELAVQATELGRYEDAIDLWNRLIELRPDFDGAYINAVKPYAELGRIKEALIMAKKGIALSPGKREAVFHYALCEFYDGNYRGAQNAIEAFISKDKDYPPLLALLAALCIILQREEEGRRLIERLRKMGFNYPEYACIEARKLSALGRPGDACTLLSTLIAAHITSPHLLCLYRECLAASEKCTA